MCVHSRQTAAHPAAGSLSPARHLGRFTDLVLSLSLPPSLNGCATCEQKACEIVKQAIDADIKQEWSEAFKLYKCARVRSSSSPATARLTRP